jgi:hypothetical protein
LRQHHELIRALGGDIVAIGTGNLDYALSFVADEHIPFLVLVDDDAQAAAAASDPEISWRQLLHPRSWRATWADASSVAIASTRRQARAAGRCHLHHRSGRSRALRARRCGRTGSRADSTTVLGVVASVTLRPCESS